MRLATKLRDKFKLLKMDFFFYDEFKPSSCCKSSFRIDQPTYRQTEERWWVNECHLPLSSSSAVKWYRNKILKFNQIYRKRIIRWCCRENICYVVQELCNWPEEITPFCREINTAESAVERAAYMWALSAVSAYIEAIWTLNLNKKIEKVIGSFRIMEDADNMFLVVLMNSMRETHYDNVVQTVYEKTIQNQ